MPALRRAPDGPRHGAPTAADRAQQGHGHDPDRPRAVQGEEAERIGLANRQVEPRAALAGARELAWQIALLPQAALRSDRLSALEQWSLDRDQATLDEFRHGVATVATGEMEAVARRCAAGDGRHGKSPVNRALCCTNATRHHD